MARTKEEIEADRIMAEVRRDKEEIYEIFARAGVDVKSKQK